MPKILKIYKLTQFSQYCKEKKTYFHMGIVERVQEMIEFEEFDEF